MTGVHHSLSDSTKYIETRNSEIENLGNYFPSQKRRIEYIIKLRSDRPCPISAFVAGEGGSSCFNRRCHCSIANVACPLPKRKKTLAAAANPSPKREEEEV
eukprot:TRINITY_DN4773_c1_g2_i2.p2 TRINITY_DN4773_c1_g2~~TRINITY_DN4773_c1_g2_i2.p2  ORF type:complete len:101 (-),score=8.50 TRINITY_DN4773_c1_g2_i2:155-457(-)